MAHPTAAVLSQHTLRVAAPAGAAPNVVELSGPCVLVLLRHVGCNCAPLGLADALAALDAAGVTGRLPVFAVSPASDAATAYGLVADAGLAARPAFTLVLDPTLALYRALGVRRSVCATFTWRRWRNIVGAAAFPFQACCRGRVPFVTGGDPWQQGAVFVFGSDAALFVHRDVSPGWPMLDEPAFAVAARAAAAEVAAAAGVDEDGGRTAPRGARAGSRRRRARAGSSATR